MNFSNPRERKKRTLGEPGKSSNDTSSSKRSERRERLKEKPKETKWKRVKLSDTENEMLDHRGVKVNKAKAIRPRHSAKRAKRVIGRMDNQDKKRSRSRT